MPVKKRVTSRVRRMVGGAAAAICPPGVWCMDTGFLVLCGVLLVVAAYIWMSIYNQQKAQAQAPVTPTIVVVEKPSAPAAPIVIQQDAAVDPRFQPLAPERSFDTPPDLRGFPSPPVMAGRGAIPINQMTRGAPEQFQQIGVLTAPGGSETSASPTRTILPLFGRKVITNRDRWNYYTRTDGMNPVQVPIQYKSRKCDDDNGCDEIMEGDTVSVPVLGQSYVATVYRYSTPRYIPF